MNLQPNLSSGLLSIRPLLQEDFEALYAVACDPLIWELHPEPTRHQRDVFTGFFAKAMESKGALLVCHARTGEVLGSSRYYDLQAGRVTIGYTFLKRAYWGGVFNGEMKRLMLGHAFAHVDRVLFEIGEHNLRSRRAIEKIGGRLVGADILDGQSHMVYEIQSPVRSAWDSAAGGGVWPPPNPTESL